jgi:glycosyltransferase involved in cell wall biosynthesis
MSKQYFDMKKLSITIPVYNAESYLRRCLDHIYCQIDSRCEVIMIDDGSKDKSGDICDEYQFKYPKLTTVYHKVNEGAGATRNLLIDKAQGDYIWFVDSDDMIESHSIGKIISFLEDHPDVDILSMAYKKVVGDKSNCVLENVRTVNSVEIVSGNDALLKDSFDPYLWSKVYRKEFIDENNLYFNRMLNSQEDWLFNMNAFCLCKNIAFTDIYAYNYYQDNMSSTLRNKSKENQKRGVINSLMAITEYLSLMRKYQDSSIYPSLVNWNNYILSGFFYSLIFANYPISDIKKIIKDYKKIHLYPIGETNNKKANLFISIANKSFLFIIICRIMHFLKYRS